MSHPTNTLLMEMAREQMEEEKDWNEHRTIHNTHPSMNCPFCMQDADMPEEEERETAYAE